MGDQFQVPGATYLPQEIHELNSPTTIPLPQYQFIYIYSFILHTGIVKRGHKTVVAVKMLKDTATESDRSDFNKELKVYRLLEPHPNIIVMLGCCTTRGRSGAGEG